MIAYTIVLGVGAIAGWELHKMYLRGAYKAMRKLRAKLRGK